MKEAITRCEAQNIGYITQYPFRREAPWATTGWEGPAASSSGQNRALSWWIIASIDLQTISAVKESWVTVLRTLSKPCQLEHAHTFQSSRQTTCPPLTRNPHLLQSYQLEFEPVSHQLDLSLNPHHHLHWKGLPSWWDQCFGEQNDAMMMRNKQGEHLDRKNMSQTKTTLWTVIANALSSSNPPRRYLFAVWNVNSASVLGCSPITLSQIFIYEKLASENTNSQQKMTNILPKGITDTRAHLLESWSKYLLARRVSKDVGEAHVCAIFTCIFLRWDLLVRRK